MKNGRLRKWMASGGLAVALLGGTALTHRAYAAEPRVVEITAKRFGFVPEQITLKKGEPVTLRLHSEDVTHGFFMRKLKIDTEVEAGKTTDVTITPEVAGSYTTICDHFCGANHGNMKMTIVVE
ncbi:MAG TPA: cupredoxin domain-containing protein [Terriglobales bacterium]|nr:cupredoxin domain-containing protein [Terriglobales bacterium]